MRVGKILRGRKVVAITGVTRERHHGGLVIVVDNIRTSMKVFDDGGLAVKLISIQQTDRSRVLVQVYLNLNVVRNEINIPSSTLRSTI